MLGEEQSHVERPRGDDDEAHRSMIHDSLGFSLPSRAWYPYEN